MASWWRDFADEQCAGYSPLYEAICRAVAADGEVLDLVIDAPFFGRQPNVLLAAVHDLVLRGTTHELATLYSAAGRGEIVPAAEAGRSFRDFARRNRDELAQLLSFRRTNTNECGRSAVLVPALRWAATEVGAPVALIDVGTSAGLNLRLDRYRIDYLDGRTTGPADSPVVIECAVRGPAPVEPEAPPVAARIGLDRKPVDLSDPAEVRWLLACVWPDTGRLDRTRAAIELARSHPVEVLTGDAVDDLGTAVERLPVDLPIAVTTSWVLAYLRPADRDRFVEQLATLSRRRPVAWISAEGPGVAPGIATPDATTVPGDASIDLSVLGGSIFRDGRRQLTVALGRCHPHGSTLDWTSGGDGSASSGRSLG